MGSSLVFSSIADADIARLPSDSPRSGADLVLSPMTTTEKSRSALSFLEEVTGAATIAVSESSAESIRLRRSLDALPLGLVLCDESGGVIFRNTQAEALMASRYGDAIAAQAVTEVLAEGWTNGVAERTIDIYGPTSKNLDDSRVGH